VRSGSTGPTSICLVIGEVRLLALYQVDHRGGRDNKLQAVVCTARCLAELDKASSQAVTDWFIFADKLVQTVKFDWNSQALILRVLRKEFNTTITEMRHCTYCIAALTVSQQILSTSCLLLTTSIKPSSLRYQSIIKFKGMS